MLVSKINTLLKNSVYFILSIVLCLSLVTSFAFPAAAGTPSPVTKGEANLNKIQAKTDELAQQEPPSLQDTIERSQGGLNEVQGRADANKMISPEDAQGTTTLKDKIEQALDKVTNSK